MRIFGIQEVKGGRENSSLCSFKIPTFHYVVRALNYGDGGRIRTSRLEGLVREMRNVIRIPVETFEEKRPLRRPKGMWEDNIKLDLEETTVTGWSQHLTSSRVQ